MGVRLQVLGVVLLGLLASGGAGLLMHRVERDNAEQAIDRRTAAVQDAVGSATQRYVDALQLVAGGLEALTEPDPAAFTTATEPLGRLWLPGATGVDYVVAVPDAGVAAAQTAWRERGAADLSLAPAPGAVVHYFAVLARTLGGRGPGGPGAGRDLAATPPAGAAVERAGRTGLPAASEPYVAPRDAAGTEDPRPQTVALVQRVVERRTGALRGYLQLTVRVQDLFGDTMLQPARDLLDVSLAAYAGTELRTIAAIHRGDGRADLRRTAEVQVADRRWRMRVATDSGALAGAGGHLDDGMFLGGVALTIVTALLVYTLAAARRRAEERVEEAAAELRVADAAARTQAALLGAVMDTVADGVAVIDGDGRAARLNPTARAILGPEASRRPTSEWPNLLDMREADGVTRYRSRGGGPAGTETLVECVMAGRRVEVRLRTLPPDGAAPAAVAVMRDITDRHAAEERARSSEELLQVIARLNADGFARMLAPDYDGALDEQGRRYVGRIRAGARQMREFIAGLLASARPPRQETAGRVHLAGLVADVWDELAVERAERPVELVVGELPDALGDPRLIRQVVASLIGNAVKYTRDADPARVEVGHKVTAGGEATYYVRDNGAGFDMRHADKLFKAFQRLHRAEEYEGAGIGLALAHRIVHRHGGQIWADAAPGAGATFYFTLPVGAAALEAVS